MQQIGLEAAMKSPYSGRFETNINAKHWVLIAPDGKKHECTNLSLWARNNTHLFGFEPGEASAKKIRSGISTLARSLRGDLKRPVYTYKGWSLESVPEPQDFTDYKVYKANKIKRRQKNRSSD